MAWNNVGTPVSLEPGGSVTWEYEWPDLSDHGVQIAGPNVLHAAPRHLGTLVASDQGKEIEGIGIVRYVVTITNVDATELALHNLQGGGVT